MEGKDDLKEIMGGIRLTLGEIRDLRIDLHEHLEEAARDRKQAAEDRRRSEEDRKRSEERFARYERQAAEDRRTFNGTLRAILTVARDFRAEQRKQTAILEQHTTVLHEIARAVRLRGNGQGGNGK